MLKCWRGDIMKMMRPVSDLRNNFADISKTVHETAQPVFLTKNGYGDMVVLSMDAFENLQFDFDSRNIPMKNIHLINQHIES